MKITFSPVILPAYIWTTALMWVIEPVVVSITILNYKQQHYQYEGEGISLPQIKWAKVSKAYSSEPQVESSEVVK